MIHNNGRSRRRPFNPRGRDRRGSALVLFVILLFAILGIAALVIDLGFARLAQRQMQTAVNAAALEGLRFRDDVPEAWKTDPPDFIRRDCETLEGSGKDADDWCDCVRRSLASRMVAMTFDDNLNPEDGDSLQFGAGPVIRYTNGISIGGEWNASATLTISNDPDEFAFPVYKPHRDDGTLGLELNYAAGEDDKPHGDMVAGHYRYFDENNDPVNHSEDDEYVRDDLDSRGIKTAFLVRMRRTTGNNSMDSEAGVSSSGEPLPLLFGMGAPLNSDPDNMDDPKYHPKRDGITVRATAIADAVPARSVGPAYPQNLYSHLVTDAPFEGFAGFAPFALDFSFWQKQFNDFGGASTTKTVNVRDNGALELPDIPPGVGGIVGQMIGITSLRQGVNGTDDPVILHVASNGGFPVDALPEPGFRVRIGNEILHVVDREPLDETECMPTVDRWRAIRAVNGTRREVHDPDVPIVLQQIVSLGAQLHCDPHGDRGLASFAPNFNIETTLEDSSSTLQFHRFVPPTAHTYTPLYETIDTREYIVGFGYVEWQLLSSSDNELRITMLFDRIAPVNASTAFRLRDLDHMDVDAIFRENKTLRQSGALLTPALVRSSRLP
jgi:hypothetical protein